VQYRRVSHTSADSRANGRADGLTDRRPDRGPNVSAHRVANVFTHTKACQLSRVILSRLE
jgi:hypothetical protein